MMNRLWTPDEVLQNAAWLKRMNAQGNDIYVKPAGEHGLVLVDDLKPEAIDRLKGQGVNPAIVTETSPGNLQAWLKLSRDPVDPAVRTLVARSAAQTFGGDLNSTDARHYGRLAGFTNQKPERLLDNGLHPFVLLREWSGQVMTRAREWIAQAERFVEAQEARREQNTRLTAISTWEPPKRAAWGLLAPLDEYQRQAQILRNEYPNPDWSRLDWMIVKAMAKQGHSAQAVMEALVQGSPQITSRKPGHAEDYARRTVTKAFQAPDVVHARAEQRRDAEEDRGRSR